MAKRTASCNCGKLTLETTGEPVRISVCHCHACQRRTGSVFGVQARFNKEDVRVAGESKVFVRATDDEDRILHHFCPECGSTVFYETESLEGFVGVPVGAFADRGFPPPTVSVYEERMHPWVLLPPGIEHTW
jgi:hypothetical protein